MSRIGEIFCWGDASFGEVGTVGQKAKYDEDFELGHGLARYEQLAPRKEFLALPAAAKEVYAAGFMSCAWLETNDLWCWGDTAGFHFRDTGASQSFWERMTTGFDRKKGPIYKPTFASTMPSSPFKMPDNCTPKDITVLDRQICVVCESGCAQCWGYNGNDALGYGDSKDSWGPRNECYEF